MKPFMILFAIGFFMLFGAVGNLEVDANASLLYNGILALVGAGVMLIGVTGAKRNGL